MPQEVGKLHDVLVLLQIHLGKEVAEGVGMHLLAVDAHMLTPVLEIFRKATLVHRLSISVQADKAFLAGLLNIVLHLALQLLLEKNRRYLLPFPFSTTSP